MAVKNKKIVKKTVIKKAAKRPAKKAIRKSVNKKVVKKRRVPRVRKKAPMPSAEWEKRFWIYEGPVVKDLRELHGALKSASEEQYLYHANKMKNDFASWMEDILGDKKTARAMRNAKSLNSAIRVVEKSLLEYL